VFVPKCITRSKPSSKSSLFISPPCEVLLYNVKSFAACRDPSAKCVLIEPVRSQQDNNYDVWQQWQEHMDPMPIMREPRIETNAKDGNADSSHCLGPFIFGPSNCFIPYARLRGLILVGVRQMLRHLVVSHANDIAAFVILLGEAPEARHRLHGNTYKDTPEQKRAGFDCGRSTNLPLRMPSLLPRPIQPVTQQFSRGGSDRLRPHQEDRTGGVVDHEAGATANRVWAEFDSMLAHRQQIGMLGQSQAYQLAFGIPVQVNRPAARHRPLLAERQGFAQDLARGLRLRFVQPLVLAWRGVAPQPMMAGHPLPILLAGAVDHMDQEHVSLRQGNGSSQIRQKRSQIVFVAGRDQLQGTSLHGGSDRH